MKTIIYYKTNTNFTKEYVDLLKPRIECDQAFDINKIDKKAILANENIVFMGPIRNNVIKGLDKFLKKYKYMKDKNIFVFAVGVEPISNDKKDNIIMANALQDYHLRLYLLNGGFDINRFPKIKQCFIRQVFKVASKKRPELSMMTDHPINLVNGSGLDNMVDVYYKVNRKW